MNQSNSPIPLPAPERDGEPFACPHCGQMLGRSCRVCVACQQEVEPPEMGAPQPALPSAGPVEATATAVPLERVRFPWTIFFLVLAVSMVGVSLVQLLMTPLKGQMLVAGVQVLTAVWVFYDAQTKGVPKAMRWGLGTLLLWLFIFPWYLERRSKPAARCPFVEGPAGPLTRALLVLLLLVLFILAFKSPPGK